MAADAAEVNGVVTDVAVLDDGIVLVDDDTVPALIILSLVLSWWSLSVLQLLY